MPPLEKRNIWASFFVSAVNVAQDQVSTVVPHHVGTSDPDERQFLMQCHFLLKWFNDILHCARIPKTLPVFLWGTLFWNISMIFKHISWQIALLIFAQRLRLSWIVLLSQNHHHNQICWPGLFEMTALLWSFTSFWELNCSVPAGFRNRSLFTHEMKLTFTRSAKKYKITANSTQ